MKKSNIAILTILALFLLTGAGCSLLPKLSLFNPLKPTSTSTIKDYLTTATTSLKQQLANQSKIKKFNNYDELKTFLETKVNSYSPYYGLEMMDRAVSMPSTLSAESAMPLTSGMTKSLSASDSSAGSLGSTDYSQTNIQVAGVDEADIIKTDGKYIYAVAKNDLYIVDAYPATNASIVSKIAFKSRPQDIFINGNYLVIYGADDQIAYTENYKKFRRRNSYTFLKVFDITDKKNPKQVRDLNFEGYYSNSRMIGDYVYFVTNNYSYYYLDNEPIIPRVLENGQGVATSCAGTTSTKCVLPDIYYFDMPYQSYNFTAVTAINVKNNSETINQDLYLLSGNENMYVSQNNIYLSYTKYVSEYQLYIDVMKEIVYPLLSTSDKTKISKIEQTDESVLTKDEKTQKISAIINFYYQSLSDSEQDKLEKVVEKNLKAKYQDISKELEKTVIHKIAIDKNNLTYKATGEVTGQVLNQFSMDEDNDYFRIATTKNQTWSRYLDASSTQSYNNLYILDSDLKTVGKIEDLAHGEKIYSVRFMQSRAYMVTFKQVDPLFVIDVKDPKNPKVLGKLKIPGFSSYLHPYDDTTLIGLGHDTATTSWGGVQTKGIKLSLFDVTNVSSPKEINSYVMSDAGSDSLALQDHKAFLFSKDKNLLAIPVTIYESSANSSWSNKFVFSGAVVFKVDKTGFKLQGKIDHSDGGKTVSQDYWDGYYFYDNNVRRALYISDTLYTISNQYLKMNKLSDLSEIKKLELKKVKAGKSDDYEVVN